MMLEGVEPVAALAIPRAAVLSDQQGDYVYVVDGQNQAEQRRIELGQSTPSTAVITSGLKEGEMVMPRASSACARAGRLARAGAARSLSRRAGRRSP